MAPVQQSQHGVENDIFGLTTSNNQVQGQKTAPTSNYVSQDMIGLFTTAITISGENAATAPTYTLSTAKTHNSHSMTPPRNNDNPFSEPSQNNPSRKDDNPFVPLSNQNNLSCNFASPLYSAPSQDNSHQQNPPGNAHQPHSAIQFSIQNQNPQSLTPQRSFTPPRYTQQRHSPGESSHTLQNSMQTYGRSVRSPQTQNAQQAPHKHLQQRQQMQYQNQAVQYSSCQGNSSQNHQAQLLSLASGAKQSYRMPQQQQYNHVKSGIPQHQTQQYKFQHEPAQPNVSEFDPFKR